MTQELIDSRVGKVETEQARQGERLDRMESDIHNIGEGVKTLLDRDAKRPDGMTWKSIAATCGGLLAVAVVVAAIIELSPSVRDLDKRLSKLDDPDVGKVGTIEGRVGELEAWRPRVTR